MLCGSDGLATATNGPEDCCSRHAPPQPLCQCGDDHMMRPELTLLVYLCREPVDMRKSIDVLSLLVQEAMELNPFGGTVFVF